jgi:hypothetical protein
MTKLALILVAPVLAASSAGAVIPNPCPCPQPPGAPECPDVSNSPASAKAAPPRGTNPASGVTTATNPRVTTLLLCKSVAKALPTGKETPERSAPAAPADPAKALDPTKNAAPDPPEHLPAPKATP